MSFEVYTGSQAPRRGLALALGGVLLAFVTLLAGLQIMSARALQPPVAVPGTPLTLQLPKGWVPDDAEPGVFLLPAESHLQQMGIRFRKSLRVEYIPNGGFSSRPSGAEPARIGPFQGYQLPLREEILPLSQIGQLQLFVAQRRAFTPRGDRITLLFSEVATIRTRRGSIDATTGADLAATVDLIAENIRLDDDQLGVDSATALARAGLRADVPDDWLAAIPDSSFGVSAALQAPSGWFVRIHRSWLAFGTTPEDLLARYRDAEWRTVDDPAPHIMPERVRSTAGVVWRITRPAPRIGSLTAWCVSKAADEVALVELFAPTELRDVAQAAVEELIATFRFEASPSFADLTALEREGRRLAERLRDRGIDHWWPAEPAEQYYIYGVPTIADERLWVGRREPATVAGEPGFDGADLHLVPLPDGLSWRTIEWSIARDGQPATYAHQRYRMGENRPVEQYQRRLREDGLVLVETADGSATLRPSGAYVSTQISTIAEFLVASAAPDAAAIIQSDPGQSASFSTLLLRRLPPSDDGLLRVLVHEDALPTPQIYSYDASGRLQQFELATIRGQRVTAREALARFPELRRLGWGGGD